MGRFFLIPAAGRCYGGFSGPVEPDLHPECLRLTLEATLTTLAYAVCGTILSLGLGLAGGVLTSEVWWLAVAPRRGRRPSPWCLGVRALLVFPRAIHELLWGLFFVNIWGLDPLSAIVAIAIPFGAITAKVFSEILDETPRQPLEAMLNSGVAPLSALMYGLMPQAFMNLLSYSFYRFECSLRSAAVLGIIGAGGLGYQILLSLQSLRYNQLWTFFFALFLLNGLVDWSSAWVRQQLGCPSRLDLNLHQRSRSKLVQQRLLLVLTDLGILLIPFCFWYVDADFSKLWSPQTRGLLTSIFQAASLPPKTPLPQLLTLAGETLAMSLLAIAGAGLGGILLSFTAAHNLMLPGGLFNPGAQSKISRIGAWATLLLTRAVLLLCRAIPAPIWALVLLFVLFPGILPGAIALYLGFYPLSQWLMEQLSRWFDFAERSLYLSEQEFEKTRPAREAQNAFWASIFSVLPFLAIGGFCYWVLVISLGQSWALSMGLIACIGSSVYELGRRDGQSS